MKSMRTVTQRNLCVLTLFLLLLQFVLLACNAQRTPLQKWLGAEWTERHERPLHWFMEQHAYAPNVTSRIRLVAQAAGVPLSDDNDNDNERGGRYIVARLSRLTRAERRHARHLLAAHSADTHTIDDTHVLVFVDAASSARLRAAPHSAPLAAVSVLDVYAAQLKLSRALRVPLGLCRRGRNVRLSRAWPLRLRGRVALDVRTAVGQEIFVAAALRRAVPLANCDWSFAAQQPGSGFVRVALHSRNVHIADHRGEDNGAALCRCRALIDAAAQHSAVRWIEPAVETAAAHNDIASALVQHSAQGNAKLPVRPLWDAGINGSGEIVAMADSGVDFDSCFFGDRTQKVAIFPATNEHHRKIISYYPFDLVPEKYFIGDRVGGHGTHVAGTAVGHALGVGSQYDGVAKGAKLFFRGLSSPEDKQLLLPDDIRDVFRPGYSIGARVFSNSWGFWTPLEYTGVEKSLDMYTSVHWDSVLLFASGNTPSAGLLTPCRAKNTLCIGSHVNSFDPPRRDTLSSFASHGPSYDGRSKPELVSAGESVTSAYSDQNLSSWQCSMSSKRGTSMATAVVAGAAALLRQHLRTLEGHAKPSAALVKALLVHSSAYLNKWETSGFGRLDLSIFFTPTGVRGWFRDNETIAHHGTSVYCFTAGAVATAEVDLVKVTLAWTDVGTALEGSLRSVVNDLDLVVVDSTGAVHLTHGTKRDNTNVMEQIRLTPSPELAAGFRVFVYGENVHDIGLQHYALVVSAPNLQYHATCGSGSNDNVHDNKTDNDINVFPKDAACAGNCSGAQGGGVCHDGQCVCAAGRLFVDCSLCDEEHMCNGRGRCIPGEPRCICDSDNFADDACLTCKPGWYGPSCSANCTCSGHGECPDKATGKCACDRNTTIGGSGCFNGPNCEFCCKDFAGAGCNERSYWCDRYGETVVAQEPSAYIQINGYGKYATMLFCAWDIIAPAGHTVHIEYLKFDVDPNDDLLTVYDAVKDEANPVRSDAGVVAAGTTFVSSSNVLSLTFTSHWGRVRHGFLLRYKFVPPQPADCGGACVTGVVCDAFAGGFCLCAPERAGWHCERAASSSLSSSSLEEVFASTQILRESQVMRLSLLVNERVAVAPLRLRPPRGRETHLSVALPLDVLAAPQPSPLALLLNVSATQADGTSASAAEYVTLGDGCGVVRIVVAAALRGTNEKHKNNEELGDMNVSLTLLHSARNATGSGVVSVVSAVHVTYKITSVSRQSTMHCSSEAPAGVPPVAFGVVKSRENVIVPIVPLRGQQRSGRTVYLIAAALALCAGAAMGAATAIRGAANRPPGGEGPSESAGDEDDLFSSLQVSPRRAGQGDGGRRRVRSGKHTYMHVTNGRDSDNENVNENVNENIDKNGISKYMNSGTEREDQNIICIDEDVEMSVKKDVA